MLFKKEKFAFGQHKVRADIFTGSLAIFIRRSFRSVGAEGIPPILYGVFDTFSFFAFS